MHRGYDYSPLKSLSHKLALDDSDGHYESSSDALIQFILTFLQTRPQIGPGQVPPLQYRVRKIAQFEDMSVSLEHVCFSASDLKACEETLESCGGIGSLEGALNTDFREGLNNEDSADLEERRKNMVPILFKNQKLRHGWRYSLVRLRISN